MDKHEKSARTILVQAPVRKSHARDARESCGITTNGGCARLPAGAVAAAAAARAATDLLVAVAAINGLVAARLERHTGLAATRRANGGIHLARRSLPTVRAATTHRRLARRAALRAARRCVHQPFACVKFLLAGREHELTTALATPKRLIGGQNCLPLFRLDRATGDGADHAPRPWRKPSR